MNCTGNNASVSSVSAAARAACRKNERMGYDILLPREIIAAPTENFFCYIRVTKNARVRIFRACGFFILIVTPIAAPIFRDFHRKHPDPPAARRHGE